MSKVVQNHKKVVERIKAAAVKCGRDLSSIKLIAVSKKQSSSAIRELTLAGHRIFAENYAQEFREKAEELSSLNIEWHFIGHLQTNKVKYVTPYAHCIHSIDSVRLAGEVNKRAPEVLDCFVEVNVAGEGSKTGIATDGIFELVKAIREMENLNLIGLMTMPPFDAEPEHSRPYFIQLRKILEKVNGFGIYPKQLKYLSMGMTGDLEVAIEEGATHLRVGTAIFGKR